MSTALEKRWYSAVGELGTCSLCGKYGIQVSHRNEGRGMGQKSPPHMTAALCPEHHFEIDNGRDLPQAERRALMDRAIVLTHSRLVESGRLVLK
jgi:hypothetical protein